LGVRSVTYCCSAGRSRTTASTCAALGSRPCGVHWENYLDFMVAARQNAVVTADGLNNIRKLI